MFITSVLDICTYLRGGNKIVCQSLSLHTTPLIGGPNFNRFSSWAGLFAALRLISGPGAWVLLVSHISVKALCCSNCLASSCRSRQPLVPIGAWIASERSCSASVLVLDKSCRTKASQASRVMCSLKLVGAVRSWHLTIVHHHRPDDLLCVLTSGLFLNRLSVYQSPEVWLHWKPRFE